MQLTDAMKRLTDLYQDADDSNVLLALSIVAADHVTVRSDGSATVRYADDEVATVDKGQCDCDPLRNGLDVPCAHMLAVELSCLLQDQTPQRDAGGVLVPIVERHIYRREESSTNNTARSIRAIVADLSQPLPRECVATKTLKGTAISYLHWQTVSRVLDAYAPGWSGHIARIDQLGKNVAVTYRITIPCAEGTVTREATGQEEEDLEGYGDSTSNAEAMAFKRAAAKFGVGLWLYDKDATAQALERHIAGVPARSGVAPKDRPVPAVHEAPANGTAWRAVLMQYKEDVRLTEGLRAQITRALQSDTNHARGTALAATVQQAVKAQL